MTRGLACSRTSGTHRFKGDSEGSRRRLDLGRVGSGSLIRKVSRPGPPFFKIRPRRAATAPTKAEATAQTVSRARIFPPLPRRWGRPPRPPRRFPPFHRLPGVGGCLAKCHAALAAKWASAVPVASRERMSAFYLFCQGFTPAEVTLGHGRAAGL